MRSIPGRAEESSSGEAHEARTDDVFSWPELRPERLGEHGEGDGSDRAGFSVLLVVGPPEATAVGHCDPEASPHPISRRASAATAPGCETALADGQLRVNLARATATIRARWAAAVDEVADWEELRAAGAAIKASTMARLPELLERLEESVVRAGGVVHWARDAAEANAIVAGVAHGRGVSEVIKVKSIATDEIGLNGALAAEGITAVETDLAELINQLAGGWSSHILVPAIHRNRAEIRRLFERTIAGGASSPTSQPPSPRPPASTCASGSSPPRWP